VIILGSGLSGLLAGALDRPAVIFEQQEKLPNNHHAVLRFREDKIGRALNIDFRKVRVLKGIHYRGVDYYRATPRMANEYARKVTGAFVDRSIMNLEPVDRYIAPPDFIQQLAEMCAGRIEFGYRVTESVLRDMKKPLISTIPLPATLHMLYGPQAVEALAVDFAHNAIQVHKFFVPGADIFQTIYFPAPETPVYRATMTGDLLMIESVSAAEQDWNIKEAIAAFGFNPGECEPRGSYLQQRGKILPVPGELRRSLLLRLTRDFHIYSLGRYACWRNILLDDVYEDYFRIRRMMKLGEYNHIKGMVR
jgi:hypothetical protein